MPENGQGSSLNSRLPIAVTMGDAAGVGPELCLELLRRYEGRPATSAFQETVPVIVGGRRILERVAERLGRRFTAAVVTQPMAAVAEPTVWDVPGGLAADSVIPGLNQAACGKAAGAFISEAVRGCQAGLFGALCTAPISKRALNLGGLDYPGHTELLSELTRSPRTAMLLYSQKLAVGLVTTHQSLRSVAESLSVERIVEVATLLNRYLLLLREGRQPRLAVLGLNPHAGEEGLFGDEEGAVVAPALRRIQALGIQAEGPLPPDTAFTTQALQRYDGHVALYHDQGSIPFKMASFDCGVNVTMGLDIPRTSPDHGTAFDIAWQGKVDVTSFMASYELAARLAVALRRRPGGKNYPSRVLPAVQEASGK